MDKYREIKAEFDAFFNDIQPILPRDGRDSALDFFIAAILKTWGSNQSYSPDYADLLSAVTGRRYTMEQILTAMRCCADPARRLRVPEFIRRSVETDALRHTKITAAVLEAINDLLVASAMVNGDFTIEEATAVSQIMAMLIAHASASGIEVPDALDNDDRVTARNEASYFQNAAQQAARQKPALEDIDPSPADDEPSQSCVTINVTLSDEEESDGSALGFHAGRPEEAAAITKPGDDGETVDSLLAELDGLVGLDSVKRDVRSLMNFIRVSKIREQRGKKVPVVSYHLVFTGNPGTGKTTVARLVAKLYYHIGILPQGQLVETDRSALVAGYLGQTAIKTQKVIQQAMGGVLFIDEAYALAGDAEDSYGKEAIETILKAMEDHRNELVVIVAGYTELMRKFIDSNPGLSSRFSKYFEFPDYTGEELLAIFNRFCDRNGYALDPAAASLLGERFDALYSQRDAHFGNARTARNLFEKAINAQADRIAVQESITDDDLEIITVQDIVKAIGGV